MIKYISMVQEKTVAGPAKRDPRFPNIFPSSEMTPFVLLPGTKPALYVGLAKIAGLNQGYDQVVIRGDNGTGRSFASFYLRAGQLIAADCVNRPQEFMLSKKLIAEQLAVNADQLADESISVKDLLK